MAVRFAVGMDLALPDPTVKEIPDWSVDRILTTVVDQVALIDGYELRTLLRWDADVDCPHDVTSGEMLYLVGEAIGGPLDQADADAVLTEAEQLGRTGELEDALAPLLLGQLVGATRMLILPPHCMLQLSRRTDGPLRGVAYVPAAELKKLLAEAAVIPEVAHLVKLADFCMRTRVVLSARL